MTILEWCCAGFDELTVAGLDAIYRARQEVFVIEQQCIYQDADGCDSRSLHLGAWAAAAGDGGLNGIFDAPAAAGAAPSDGRTAARPLAYARILPPGLKYPEPSIGRVLTAAAARGTGLGRELVRRAVDACSAHHPGLAIRISAQARLQAFYASFDFESVGLPYDEDGIPHLEMLRPPVPVPAPVPGPVPPPLRSA